MTIGGSTNLANQLGLPLKSALVEKTADGERGLGREKFYTEYRLQVCEVVRESKFSRDAK